MKQKRRSCLLSWFPDLTQLEGVSKFILWGTFQLNKGGSFRRSEKVRDDYHKGVTIMGNVGKVVYKSTMVNTDPKPTCFAEQEEVKRASKSKKGKAAKVWIWCSYIHGQALRSLDEIKAMDSEIVIFGKHELYYYIQQRLILLLENARLIFLWPFNKISKGVCKASLVPWFIRTH